MARPSKGTRKPAKPRGRPSLWSPTVAARIIEQLSQGINLVDICRAEGMPKVRTVNRWAEQRPAFSADFARAREEGCDAIAAEAMRIADTPMPGVSEKYEQVAIGDPDDPDGGLTTEFRLTERKVEDMLGHRKLQIDTRLKLLAVWSKRYSPKAEVAHTGHLTLEQLVAGTAPAK